MQTLTIIEGQGVTLPVTGRYILGEGRGHCAKVRRDLNAEDAEVFAEGLFPGRLEPMIAAVVTVSRPGGRRTRRERM